MKATDRQLLDISEELTAYIMKPTFNLCLSPDECIILNKLITEEFERRQEQDVMGSSNGQDTPLGQTRADNNDVALNASECRDSEVSGVEVRKEKTQITKVSHQEYLENFENRGRWNPKKWYNTHYVKPKIYPLDPKPFKEQGVKIVDGLRVKEEKGEGDKKYPAPPKSDTTITRPVQKVEVNTNETTEEKIWKIPPILQAIIKDVHFVLCTETTEEYKDIFEVGKIYPTRGNNNGIHIIGIAGHGDPYDLLCHTWGDENGCAHHPADLGDELPPTFIPLESLDLGTFQFPIDN